MTGFRPLLAVMLLLAALAPVQALAQAQVQAQTLSGKATLVIHVQNVSPKGGILRLGLYNGAGYATDGDTVASADVKAISPQTTITLHSLIPGTYAIQAFQDFNVNGKMDTSWIGLPLEPYGFSRDARPVLSRPGFDTTRFELLDGMNVQTLRLQNNG
jgi:uncharacterized protein (DUF2141 family)